MSSERFRIRYPKIWHCGILNISGVKKLERSMYREVCQLHPFFCNEVGHKT
jgi:hypothetical protein